MPTRPLGPCWSPGCANRADCATHRREASRRDQQERGTAHARGYDRAQHQWWRMGVLDKEPWCRDPSGRHPGARVASRAADHIVPLRDWDRDPRAAALKLHQVLFVRFIVVPIEKLSAWSYLNGQGLCVSCHNAKSQHERGERARAKL